MYLNYLTFQSYFLFIHMTYKQNKTIKYEKELFLSTFDL